MPAFRSNALNQSAVARAVRRSPLLFGIPFVGLIVGTSFGLQAFTQTRYDLHSQKVTQVRACAPVHPRRSFHSTFLPSHIVPCIWTVGLTAAGWLTRDCLRRAQLTKEQALGLDRNRKKFDIREEYFVSPALLMRVRVCTDSPNELTGARLGPTFAALAESERGGRRRVGAQAHPAAQGPPGVGRPSRRAAAAAGHPALTDVARAHARARSLAPSSWPRLWI